MSLTGVINDDLLTLVHAHFIIIVITEGLLFLGVWEVGVEVSRFELFVFVFLFVPPFFASFCFDT